MAGVEIVGDPVYGTEKVVGVKSPVVDSAENGSSSMNVNIAGTIFNIDSNNQLHRKLTGRQIQLFAIGGTIGSGVFLAMGSALAKGGAASLFLAYLFYSCIVGMVNNSAAEMATFMPINAAFIRHPSKWVDQAWGFMVGWNYFIYLCLGLPFEITGVSIFLTFWRDDIPVAAVICVCIVIYILLNIFAVNYYGEAEFWLSIGKCLLFVIVFSFTFITMVGGNPLHDAYGFRYWKNPGAFMPYVTTGNLGRFEGFLACYWQASYLIAGPDYVSLVAGEAIQPRKTLKAAFKTMYARFAIIFVGSALCIGIVVSANDPTLLEILGGEISGAGTGSASPYIIAMKRLHVSVLPHIVNALLVTSVFSAGNSYVYAGTRSLYGLAMQGQAPKFLRKCTKSGVPIYCMGVTICFASLAFLQLNSNSAVVYQWQVQILRLQS